MSRINIFRKLNPNTIIIATFADIKSAEESIEEIQLTFQYPNAKIELNKSQINISNITSDLYLQHMLSYIEKMGAKISIK